MRLLDAIEESIWNVGERLIPGVTHNVAEVVRHKSSYQFFRRVIETDLLSRQLAKSKISILDIGCGVGHGAYMLADIPGACVTAIDSSREVIAYAIAHYGRDNVTYEVADAIAFIRNMPEFDYIVSRHSLEHIPDGIAVAAECRFAARLMVNVPFEEPEGNPHHHEHFIREESFEKYTNRELFYEDLDGVTFSAYPSEKRPNSIICISSRNDLAGVAPQLSFPVPAWQPEFLQGKWLEAVDRQSDLDSVLQQQSSRAIELSGRESRVASREADLSGRESQAARREVDLALRESQFASREGELATRESRSTVRESELAARENRVAALAEESSDRAQGVRQRESELTQWESTLRSRDAQLVEQRLELEKQVQTFESRLIVRAYRRIKRLL